MSPAAQIAPLASQSLLVVASLSFRFCKELQDVEENIAGAHAEVDAVQLRFGFWSALFESSSLDLIPVGVFPFIPLCIL